MTAARHGVSSEVGPLRTVMLHRPGDELRRLTPRNNDELLFDGVPWVDRAQEEHDAFAGALRERGVEVLYLREQVLASALRPEMIGPTLAASLGEHLLGLESEALADVLIGGMAHGELPVSGGLVDRMTAPLEFIIRPLPNVLFTRDSSVWLETGVAVGELAPARAVLAVPIAQDRATMHLDTVCTMVDRDAVVMYPLLADTLVAFTTTPGADGATEVAGPEPFLLAAARAMGIDRLRVIDTGLDAVTAEREQWDDGNNTLALAPGLVVAYERNIETNRRLEAAGIEVVRIAGSELGTGRGGPRCMSCPVLRDPLAG